MNTELKNLANFLKSTDVKIDTDKCIKNAKKSKKLMKIEAEELATSLRNISSHIFNYDLISNVKISSEKNQFIFQIFNVNTNLKIGYALVAINKNSIGLTLYLKDFSVINNICSLDLKKELKKSGYKVK